MGISTSAVLLYGIPIPADHPCAAYRNEALLDVVLKGHEGVSHASAGPYDRDTRYICTDFYDAEISRYTADDTITITPFDRFGTKERNARLEHAAMDLKLNDHPAPAWYLIANQG